MVSEKKKTKMDDGCHRFVSIPLLPLPANEFVTSTRPPDPTSPSRIPTTRFLVSRATRVWWSTTDRSTRGCTVTSDGAASIDDDGVDVEAGAASPPPLAASVVIVAEEGEACLSCACACARELCPSGARRRKRKRDRENEREQSFFFFSSLSLLHSFGEEETFFFLLSTSFPPPLPPLRDPTSMGERPVRLPPELEDVPPRPLEVRRERRERARKSPHSLSRNRKFAKQSPCFFGEARHAL